jgi:hypothetical protein
MMRLKSVLDQLNAQTACSLILILKDVLKFVIMEHTAILVNVCQTVQPHPMMSMQVSKDSCVFQRCNAPMELTAIQFFINVWNSVLYNQELLLMTQQRSVYQLATLHFLLTI